MSQPNLLSDRLRETRNLIADYRHGGVVLSSEQVELLVQCLDGCAETARDLEIFVRDFQLVSRDALDRLVPPASATVLHMMRPGTNVVPFPRSPHTS
ncbi:hypothetical protein M0412_15175 [Agrobacterium sp. O3.4]|uniref:Uncharacterized protein n=1 Tax=Agrobacterium cucumeris TaxID=2862866 RepID=A0ABY8RTK4_9HYPH|nr:MULTISPECIES: hypothetical protein [Rhizobium/Agrobacterium group]MCZ7469026.1 hypothetical protein [Rhizobium rhizogenes]WHO10277.1 hypothetical protein KZ699_17330 [Agrobacterium cucumeris]